MKLIKAVIKPHRLDPVHEALVDLGVTGLTASEVKGFDRQMGHGRAPPRNGIQHCLHAHGEG